MPFGTSKQFGGDRFGSVGRFGAGRFGEASVADKDATAFIAAAGITDGVQKQAINALVKDLKAAGVWTLCAAIYPFVGGSASAHKFNLKDPRNVDAAYRLTFVGGLTHNANGVTPNGSTGYANTYYNPVTAELSLTSAHLAYYQMTASNTDTSSIKIGAAFGPSIADRGFFIGRISTGTIDASAVVCAGIPEYTPSTPITTSRSGFDVVTTRGNRTAIQNHNGADDPSGVVQSGAAFASTNVFLFAVNVGVPAVPNNKPANFASIGAGLTAAQCLAYYNAVQKFNTTLNRTAS